MTETSSGRRATPDLRESAAAQNRKKTLVEVAPTDERDEQPPRCRRLASRKRDRLDDETRPERRRQREERRRRGGGGDGGEGCEENGGQMETRGDESFRRQPTFRAPASLEAEATSADSVDDVVINRRPSNTGKPPPTGVRAITHSLTHSMYLHAISRLSVVVCHLPPTQSAVRLIPCRTHDRCYTPYIKYPYVDG